MALSRVKTWVDGERLFAADQNGEFNNILNNPITLISPTTGAINFNGQAHTGLLPSAVTGTSGSTGQLVGINQAGSVVFINVGSAVSRVSGLVGTLSSQVGTFAADGFVMRSSSALTWSVTATSSFGASIGTGGPAAGGRDVAGAFSSTEVHWYAITTGPGSTAPACVVSSQAPPAGPVLPANYAGWTYLGGSAYTSASTTVMAPHRFRGGQAFFDERQSLVSSATSTGVTTVTYSSQVPANALSATFVGNITNASTSAQVASFSHSTTLNYAFAIAGPSSGDQDAVIFTIPNVSRTVISNSGSTNGSRNILAIGYTMPNGDV